MDQVKIGKFISECRKNVGLTQKQLAEKLCITDRAVSKWETSKTLPDSAIMLELCLILKITVNDLLSGEVVSMDNYNKELEKKLFEMVEQKEKADKRLLNMEIIVGVISIVFMLTLALLASLIQTEEWIRILIVFGGMVPLLIATPFMLKIEQMAGYYECAECGHGYTPTFKAINLAPHMGRTRKMKCPECGKKSWQKKVLSKEK